MRDLTTTVRELAATHEAGHAVVALLRGFRIGGVWHAAGDGETVVLPGPRARTDDLDDVTAAGFFAEELHPARATIDVAERFCRDLLRFLSSTEEAERQRRFKQAGDRLRTLLAVPGVALAVRTLAAELYPYGSLDGDQVATIVAPVLALPTPFTRACSGRRASP